MMLYRIKKLDFTERVCRTMKFTSAKAPLWSIFPFIFEQWNNHYVSNKRKVACLLCARRFG